MPTSKQMAELSRKSQIEKYGGEKKYKEEMRRRASLGGKATWEKLRNLTKSQSTGEI